ncbi:hypothetical protein ASG63_08380 [Methylobacterium sp. Leaf94]|uniref:hypothetical protein n=1 Tax=Methylobacterium sp. Leaf94 TaxID=1736250 RepID=UPI0006F8380F|nr:hypothetical protein [Methylobacterium sp. Leaf94]KQU19141.1 hypothetical protein ASG63_08380 [Methylobacterium sp. Leaf94]
MTFAAPRRLGFLALMLGFLPVLAHAQTPPSSASGRTWTDPPPRGTDEAKAPLAKVPLAKAPLAKSSQTKAPVTKPEAPEQAAAAPAEARRPTHAAVRTPKSARGNTQARVRVARPAASPSRRPAVRTVARAQDRQDPAVRRVTTRPPVMRYSYGVVPESTGPFGYEDDRARRIRQAQEAGYLVVRSRSVEFPDGRRLRTYRPYEEEGDD